jgi:hypothetical protein
LCGAFFELLKLALQEVGLLFVADEEHELVFDCFDTSL